MRRSLGRPLPPRFRQVRDEAPYEGSEQSSGPGLPMPPQRKRRKPSCPVEDLEREVQRELTAHLANDIAKAVFQDLNAGPSRGESSRDDLLG
jgi:hypothetical protein